MRTSWPLVGRADELRLVVEVLERAERGGVVLAGAAGCGKTRLAVEALAAARERGLATEWVVASPAASSMPFAPFAHLLPADAPSDSVALDMLRLTTKAIAGRGNGGGVVLGVDDAHLLDPQSAALLHHLASTRTAFVIATLRSGEPVPDSVLSLWKDELAERIELQSLSRAEVRELVTGGLEGRVDSGTVQRLFTASGGNPLYLREIVVAGLESGALAAVHGAWTWSGELTSPRLVELISARLAGLDDAARDAVELVAFAEPVEAGLASTLVDADTLESLERRGLLQVTSDGRRSLVLLAHPLYGEVLRASAPRLRAASVKRRLAGALRAAGPRPEDVIRIACWLLEAGEPTDPALLVEAASRAATAMDSALAERLGRAAVDAGGGFEAVLVLAAGLSGAGYQDEAADLLAGVEASAASDDERSRVGRALSNAVLFAQRGLDEALEVSVRAERSVSDQDQVDNLRAHRAGMLLLAGRTSEAVGTALPVIEREGASTRHVLTALAAAVPALALLGRTQDAFDVLRPWEAVAVRSGQESLVDTAWIFAGRIMASWFGGALGEAEAVADLLYQSSLGDPEHGILGGSTFACGRIALVRGHVRTAIAWLEESASSLRRHNLGGLRPWCFGSLAHAHALAGDAAAASRVMQECDAESFVGWASFEADIALARAWVAAASGAARDAGRLAIEAADVAAAREQAPLEAMALHDAVRFGASGVDARLESAAARTDGVLVDALVADTHARDGAALEAVAASFEGMGADLLAAEAWTRAERAHASAGRGASARRCAFRAETMAAACEGARTAYLATPSGGAALTSRELEIATMAAQGLSSREIAGRLVVSVRTVDNHLYQAYAKLGVSGRAELAEALGRAE